MTISTLSSLPMQFDWMLRIFIAALCGGAIGYERAVLRKSAGMKTHIVVAVASALFMIVSKYGFTDILYLHNISLDPSRIAAQIVTGISFIGAGTILVRREQISGLTTAAGVWATAAIGMAVGSGMYTVGILSTAFVFIVQILFHDDVLSSKLIRHIRFDIQIKAKNKPDILNIIHDALSANGVESISLKILDIDDNHITLNADGTIQSKLDENKIILALRKNTDIIRVTYSRDVKE